MAETFTRALESWPSYDASRGTAAAWLFRIARNTVADFWRGRAAAGASREQPVPEERLDRAVPSVEEPVLRRETFEAIRRGIDALSERERDAIALRFGAGLRAAEVGDALGVSEAAAKMLTHRAVQKLKGAVLHGR